MTKPVLPLRGRAVPLCTWLTLLVAVAAPALRAQELPFRHYTTQNEINPLPAPAVTDVYQDTQGYVWIANYGVGLVRYDGQRMEVYNGADGLVDTQIFQVLQDGAGRLWVVASGQSLAASEKPLADYGPGERIQFTDTLGTVPLYQKSTAFPVNLLAVDRDGDLWFGSTADGLVQYAMGDDGSVRADTVSTAPSPGAPSTRVLAVGARGDGAVWASLVDGRLLVVGEGRSPARTIAAADAPCPRVIVFHEDTEGALWGGCTGSPLWKLAPGASSGFETVGPPLPGTLTGILEIAPGTIWVGGLETGVVEIDVASGEARHTYARANGLLDTNVWALMRDREGNIWVAQNSGLSRLPPNHAAFRYYTGDSHAGETPVLPGPDALAIVPDFSFALPGPASPLLVVGTSAGVAFVQRDGRVAHVTTEQGLINNIAFTLCADSQQRLWVGTREGVSVIAPRDRLPPGSSTARALPMFDATLYVKNFPMSGPNTCRAFPLAADAGSSEPPGEAVCFATARGLYCLTGDRWLLFSEGAGLPEGEYWSSAPDDSGYVYVGSKSSGAYRSTRPFSRDALTAWAGPPKPAPSFTDVAAAAFAPFTDATGEPLLDGSVTSLVWTKEALWGQSGNGLMAFRGPPWQRTALIPQEETGANHQVLVRAPTTGTLWIGGMEGMVEIDPAQRVAVRHVTKQDGLLSDETWGPADIAVGADGTVYHGSARGLTLYRPDRDAANPTPPLLAFTHVDFAQGSGGGNELNVQYAALSFASEKRVRYRTRLVGYDEGWSADTTATSLRYTNLPAVFVPRRYTFEVVAANNAGVWTEAPLQYSFSVLPPWWLRWWSFLIYALLFAGGVFAVDRVQRRRLLRLEREKTQARELEQAREIERAYHELESTHARLKATQDQLVHQEKLASLGALTAGIAHEIKNPLNFVNNFALLTGELVQELRDEAATHPDLRVADVEDLLGDIELNTSKIAEHGKRADGIIRGMLSHARGTTGHREAVDLNALADEYATLAYHGARAQQPDVQVQIEKDFDPAVGRVEVLPQEISRVLLNLLSNAFYAVGQVRSNGQATPYVPTVRIVTRRQPDAVVVRVEDNGPGIPDDVRRRIFEPFFTTKPTGEGTGLGLSLSHEIAQAHGGTLTVESQKGEGTAFVLFLPSPPPSENEGTP